MVLQKVSGALTWLGRVAASLALLAPVLASAPASAAYTGEGLILVSDFGIPAVRIFDPDANSIVFDYQPEKTSIEDCNSDKVFCFPIGGVYTRVGAEDFIDTAVTVYDRRPAGPKGVKSRSAIQRIKIGTTPQLIWTVKSLDFSAISNSKTYCDPKKVGGDSGCYPQLVHAIQIVDDRPQDKKVTVVMAEMSNHRITQATLDYTNNNTVARVDWVLGETSTEWPKDAYPNGVQIINNIAGGPYMINTFYQEGGAQAYAGAVIAYRWVNGAWVRMWTHPEDTTAGIDQLNTPHMGEILIDPATNTPWLVYSHSRGTAGDWGSASDLGGSFGIGRFDGGVTQQPTYLMDAVLFADDPNRETHFSRDVDWLADGTWLMADAACESGTCLWPSRVFRVQPLTGINALTSRGGYYAPDESGINKVAVPNGEVMEEYQCGLKTLFEVQFISRDQLGTSLSELASLPGTPCPPWE